MRIEWELRDVRAGERGDDDKRRNPEKRCDTELWPGLIGPTDLNNRRSEKDKEKGDVIPPP